MSRKSSGPPVNTPVRVGASPANDSADSKSPFKRGLSPRRRRLRWTLGILGVLSILGCAIGWVLYDRSRPKTYRPAEKLDNSSQSRARTRPKQAPRQNFVNVPPKAGLDSFRTF